LNNLYSDSLKNLFLEHIFDSDQQVRDMWSQADLIYETDKISYNKIIKFVAETDSLNQVLIDKYLELYPFQYALSEKANYTPYLVIHHSSDLKFRFKYFNFLKTCYYKGKLDENSMLFYLCRTLEIKNNKFKNSCFDKSIDKLILKVEKNYKKLSEGN
jgi:hypothetical protein